MDAAGAALRLLGLAEPQQIFRVALEWLGASAALSYGPDETAMIAPAGAVPRITRLRGRDRERALAVLLGAPTYASENLTHGDRTIGLLIVAGEDRHALEEIAPYVALALALAVDLRTAREALGSAELAAASLGSLLEGSPVARAFVDTAAKVTAVNDAFANLVERDAESCAGATLAELGAPEAQSLERIVMHVLRGTHGRSMEVATEGPILQRRVWLASAHRIMLGDKPAGAALVLQERTPAAREDARVRLVAESYAALQGESGLAVLPRLLVPSFGDWALLDVLEREVARHLAAAHADARKARWLDELPIDLDRRGRPRGVALVARTLRPDVLAADDVSMMLVADPELARAMREIGLGPQLVVPVIVGDATVAALTIGRVDGPEFTAAEVRAAVEIAGAAAQAFAHALIAERARTLRDLFEDFRGIVSREVRDPLTAIVGRLYLAMRGVDRPATLGVESAAKGGEDHLEAVRASIDRMRSAIERLLEASLPHDFRAATEPTCDVADVVRDALRRESRALSRVTLSTHIEAVTVRADCERLTEAVCVMLRHAADEAPRAGLVVVRVEREGDRALFSVSNTGEGLAAERARHAFDGLWIGDESSGSLTIARAAIEGFGGRAWIETEPGSGAAYCFTLTVA